MFSQVFVCPQEGGVHPRADTPPPADGHCSGRYASCWNAFLLMKLQLHLCGFFVITKQICEIIFVDLLFYCISYLHGDFIVGSDLSDVVYNSYLPCPTCAILEIA